jgi:hypothetical protein
MSEYYYQDNGTEAGPFTLSEMEGLLRRGKVAPAMMVRNGRTGESRLAVQWPEFGGVRAASGGSMVAAGIICFLLPVVGVILGLVRLGSDAVQGWFYIRWSLVAVLVWWAATWLVVGI